jgi:hypothetical protein
MALTEGTEGTEDAPGDDVPGDDVPNDDESPDASVTDHEDP